MHGAPHLELDDSLSREAEVWAKALAKKNVLENENNINDGENLYFACRDDGKPTPVRNAIASWYIIRCYDFVLKRLQTMRYPRENVGDSLLIPQENITTYQDFLHTLSALILTLGSDYSRSFCSFGAVITGASKSSTISVHCVPLH